MNFLLKFRNFLNFEKTNKIYFILIFLISLFLLLFISISTYNNFKNQFQATQNIINEVHKQDSLLYKQLLISDVASLVEIQNEEPQNNINSEILEELFKLQNNFNLQKNSIDRFISLEELRKEIIILHKFHLENPVSNYNFQLQELLGIYEKRQKEVLVNIEENSSNLEKELKNSLTKIFFIFFISNILLYLVFIFSLNKVHLKQNQIKNQLENRDKKENFYNKNETPRNDIFLDNQSREILEFIKNKVENNFHPTIKDIKKEFKLTHPTILSKLKKLEDNNLIEFKKDGRNKNILLK